MRKGSIYIGYYEYNGYEISRYFVTDSDMDRIARIKCVEGGGY